MEKNVIFLALAVGILGIVWSVFYFQTSEDTLLVPPNTATTTQDAEHSGESLEAQAESEAEMEEEADTTEKTAAKETYEGAHIMADGTVMTKEGKVLILATILSNGTVRLQDGTIITPAFDLRSAKTEEQPEAAHRVFTVVGTDYEYDVKEIRVKKGDTLTINFKSEEGFHDWVVDEFNAATGRVNDGGETSVTFVADKAGTFQYYCSVMSHRQMGMIGYLYVE